jgi:biopolymer transport protein ExbD
MSGSNPFSAGLMGGRKAHDDAEFDITAMIDLVFLMNIYFMFLFITTSMSQTPDLPTAAHAAPLAVEESFTITVLSTSDPNMVLVELENEKGAQIRDPVAQQQKIAAAVEAAVAQKKTKILLKCQKGVRLRETQRIAAAVAREGVTLHVAVMEATGDEK